MGPFLLNLFCREVAAKISKRPWASGLWHDSDVGHAKILRKVGARHDFTRRFMTTVSDNGVCKDGVTHLLRKCIQIYNDGSKLN